MAKAKPRRNRLKRSEGGMGAYSSREKLLGGGLALAAALYILQGSFKRVMDAADGYPLVIMEQGRMAKSMDHLTEVIEKQHDEDTKQAAIAQADAEKRQAEQREFWTKQRAEQTRELVSEIMRQTQQSQAAVAATPQRSRRDAD